MPAQARIGDLGVGICCCHSSCRAMVGPLITGSMNYYVNGLPASRLTDIVIGFCGHPGIMITSSITARINGLGRARVGDSFVGCFSGIIITGSPNEIVGN